MSRRRTTRVALFVAVLGAVLAVGGVVTRRARRPVASRGLPVPVGGAAAEDPDAGAALVEDARRYPVLTWSFPLARYDVTIEDAGMSTALDRVRERVGAELVVNAGFFDLDARPVGLSVSRGVVLSKLKRTLSGGVLVSDGERAELFPSEGFAMPDGGALAVQCRPRLVVGGRVNIARDDGKRAERTALCLREGGRVLDVVVVRPAEEGDSAGPSLYVLAGHLARAGCEAALNLDGGPSSGVAWRDREGGGAHVVAPRGPVRQVLAFVRKL